MEQIAIASTAVGYINIGCPFKKGMAVVEGV